MAKPARRPVRFFRLFNAHRRLWIAFAVGLAVALLLPSGAVRSGEWDGIGRWLLGWDVAALLYLGLTTRMMVRSGVADIRHHSHQRDEGAFGVSLLTIGAAVAGLGAVFLQLSGQQDAEGPGVWAYVLAMTTVVLSWTLVHVVFALHYAYDYYGKGKTAGALDFPGDDEPDYGDFVYFAFVIGMTFQVSDVAIRHRAVRRVALAHSVLSFFFNTAIIALTVSVAANAI